MKNKVAASLGVGLIALIVQADYVKLGAVRLASMNDAGAAVSALGILAEQPMIGMMAMGGLQQVVVQTFGQTDQSKPLGAVLYSKTALPDFKDMKADEFAEVMSGIATNLAFAIYVPVPGSEEDYLKSKGATNTVDGALTAGDELFAVVQDGYAVWGDNPTTVKQAAAEMDGTLRAKLDGMVLEVDSGKAVIRKYSEFMAAMNRMQQQRQAERVSMMDMPVKTNAWTTALEDYQRASMEASAKMLDQIDSLVIGLGADINRGINIGVFCGFVPGSDLAVILEKAVPVPPELYDAVPASADFFIAVGDEAKTSYDTLMSLEVAAQTLLPQIEDEVLRTKAESLVDGLVAITKQSGASLTFADRDKQGRMVLVSKTTSVDPAKYLAMNGRFFAEFISMIDQLAPGQKFATFDAASFKMGFDFASLVNLVKTKFGMAGDDDAEEIEKVYKALDALMGRSLEGFCKLEGGSVVGVVRAAGSDYEIPAAGDGAANAARIAAILPAGSTATPFEVGSVSLSSLIRHYGARIAAAVGEDGEATAKRFDALPEAVPGGLTVAAWAEGPVMKASMNLSASEFKWFVKAIPALDALVPEPTADFEFIDETDLSDDGYDADDPDDDEDPAAE